MKQFKQLLSNTRIVPWWAAFCLLGTQHPALGGPSLQAATATGRYLALPLTKKAGSSTGQKILKRYGVPFVEGNLKLSPGRSVRVDVACQAKRIFLLGMTATPRIGAWADPLDHSARCFIGDEVGRIRVDYGDGSAQVFPLVSGESLWWGRSFYRAPGPFPADGRFRKALAAALRLYPPMPVKKGTYVAVIVPEPKALRSISIESSSAKRMTPVIAGITVEPLATNKLAGATAVAPGDFSPEFKEFIRTKALRPMGKNSKRAQRQLNNLRLALYSSVDALSRARVSPETPAGYAGPQVSFAGNICAEILANAFAANVQDMSDKVTPDGMYHTSTKGALLWGYNGGQFGTYATNAGIYYGGSWARDLGRSLQELTVLGYTNDAMRCADFCLKAARLWEDPAVAPRIDGGFYPPHWSRIINRPKSAPPYENDGQGLITMFLYKLWQRLPDRDAWLRSRWPDVRAAGDWILWQFDHPAISGATNGVLHTTGECAASSGYSVYADAVCQDALRALAHMADSIGEIHSATQWRERADKMRKAIAANYIINDPQYGRVWTLAHAGWPTHPTVLGPLIFVADYRGFAPEDDDPALRPVNEAAYQRLIDTYKPFGFYGWAMGYGQGFVTQSALLLDRMRDATAMLDWTARAIYDPKYASFIVPEGVQVDPTGRFLYRAGDLGNGVQEAEIIKVLRLVVGVDDTRPARLQFFPRMPYGWKEMEVEKYPVLFEHSGQMEMARLRYRLQRSGRRMKLEISSDHPLGPVVMRLGPFEKKPQASDLRVNGQRQPGISIEHSGDSWWARFTRPVNSDPIGQVTK